MPAKFDEFLMAEYAQSIDLIKYYDTRHMELVKFASGLAAAVPTAVFAFRAAAPTQDEAIWTITTVLAGVTAVGLLTIFAALIQNRLYFLYPARQANAIREEMFKGRSLSNRMYARADFPAVKVLSATQHVFVAIQLGFFVGVAVYGLTRQFSWAIIGGVVGALVPLVAGAAYLRERGGKPADQAVHGTSSSPEQSGANLNDKSGNHEVLAGDTLE